MTAAEWRVGGNPVPMLEFLRARASERKLRLFAVACCRELWDQIADMTARQAVAVAELHADGCATAAELHAAHGQTPDMDPRIADDSDFVPAEKAACCVADASAFRAAELVLGHCSRADFDFPFRIWRWRKQKAQMRAFQLKALRDIFGDPSRPVAFSPPWRTPTAVAIAAGMYEARDFAAMPILADALQDAGCEDEEVLRHCREPAVHVRGCWVADAVLGKQ